jgi:RNA polymerase sigma factor (sigma-70 family)
MNPSSSVVTLVDTLYREHHGWLIAWLRKKLNCPYHAADLAHDTFTRVLTLPLVPDLREPRAYLLTIANRLIINHYHHRRVEDETLRGLALLLEDDANQDAAHIVAVRQLLEQVLLMLIEELDERSRRAFLLSRVDGLTYAEIAREFKVSESRVKQYLVRALAHCHIRLYEIKADLNEESPHRVPARSRTGNRPGALMAILLLVGSVYLAPLTEWMADERTDAGEIRQITLADGSLLTLDSKSSVDIAFTDNERRLILRAGRLLVDVASDSAANKRPFLVENRDGVSQATGTRYVVEQAEKDSLVSVIESQVVVRSRGQPDKSVGLKAGQSVRFDNQNVGQPEASLPSASSWIQARLVYEDVPLGQVIADLGRYQRVYVKLDPEVATLRFTGILPATDPEAALSLLKGALPIQIKRYTDWLVWIDAQQP